MIIFTDTDCSNNNRPDYEYCRLFSTALLIYYGYLGWLGPDQSSSISSRAPYWLSTGLLVYCEALNTGMKEEKDSIIQYLICQNGHMLLAHMKMNATYVKVKTVKTVKVKITEHLDFL